MLLYLTRPGNKFMMNSVSKVLYLMIFFFWISFYVQGANHRFR